MANNSVLVGKYFLSFFVSILSCAMGGPVASTSELFRSGSNLFEGDILGIDKEAVRTGHSKASMFKYSVQPSNFKLITPSTNFNLTEIDTRCELRRCINFVRFESSIQRKTAFWIRQCTGPREPCRTSWLKVSVRNDSRSIIQFILLSSFQHAWACHWLVMGVVEREEQMAIRAAMDHFSAVTCIQFVAKDNDYNYIRIQPSPANPWMYVTS